MDSKARRWPAERVVVIAALAFGVAAGTYGIANAASGSGSSGSSALPGGRKIASGGGPSAHGMGRPWGRQRSDEARLAGDALTRVTAAARAKLPGATVVRVETDADGNAAYEAHMVRSDGVPETVYVNKQFEVVSVDSGVPGPRGGQAPPSSSSSSGASA